MAQDTPRGSGLSSRTLARLIGGGLVLALFVIFVLQNRHAVRVNFLFWETDAGLAWALIVAGILGLLIGLALPRLRRLL